MLKMMKFSYNTHYRQHGVAAVEFAIIAMLLFTLLFGIIEFGRMFYVFNTVQEVTRRAAREAVVSEIDETDHPAKNLALFGGNSLPAGAEITVDNISIEYLKADGITRLTGTTLPDNAAENISECLKAEPNNCIAFVRVSIIGVPGPSCPSPNTSKACYRPMVPLFGPGGINLSVPIPDSTVIMPAESLGYRGLN